MPDSNKPRVQQPQEVVIASDEQDPVPVVLTVPTANPTVAMTPQQIMDSPQYATTGEGTVLAPTTTEHENTVTAGELRNARIMEYSQAGIAMAITAAVIYTAINGLNNETLANAFFVVIGFYFSSGVVRQVNGFGRPTKK